MNEGDIICLLAKRKTQFESYQTLSLQTGKTGNAVVQVSGKEESNQPGQCGHDAAVHDHMVRRTGESSWLTGGRA